MEQNTLETEWKKRNVLPVPRSSPPPSSAQKVHGVVDNEPSNAEVKPPKETKKERGATPLPPSKVVNESISVGGPSRSVAPPQLATADTTKPVQIPSKSVQGPLRDTEMDVVAEDEGQEEEGQGNRPERDPLSEEIVKQLEKGLPRWPGFGEEGWMGDVTAVSWSFFYEFLTFYYFYFYFFRSESLTL